MIAIMDNGIGEERVSARFAPIVEDDRAPGYWTILLGLPTLLAVSTLSLLPLSVPMPAYLEDARQYASTGKITDTFTPLGFAFLDGISIRALGTHGPEILEVILYLLIVLSVWALARKCGAGPRPSLIAASLAAFYPQLVVSVTKVWDLELAVLAMAVFMLLIVFLALDGPRLWLVIAIGIVFGASLSQRPNMLLLAPLPVWLCFASPATLTRKILSLVTAGALTAVTLVAINTTAHGSFFLAQNGPYNLVQGHNEFSTQVMLADLSCEPTIALILKADGIDPARFATYSLKSQQDYFTHRALAYIRSHPLEQVKITLAKLWTIFRPNTRLHDRIDVTTFLIVAMSLIFPAWLLILLRRRIKVGLDRVDRTFIVATALYVLPFLLTCADPRYQIPLEICLLAHLAYMTGGKMPAPASIQAGK
jgi:hypothetical protein